MDKKIMMYSMVLMLGVGRFGLVSGENKPNTPTNVLNTCECWSAPDDASLEVGKITLRFSGSPIINSLPSMINPSKSDHAFFIPVSGASSNEVNAMMQAVSKNNNKWYKISLSLEKKPTLGIKVVLSYDPDKVTLEYAPFDMLGEQGISFRFYNKSIINKLRVNERSLLRVVQVTPHCVMA